jgi:hypothetical protein
MPVVQRYLKWSICLLPFAVFYWLVPFCGDRTIGNDYPKYSIENQMEPQYSLARGSFPLYAPGFAGGRSAAALTLGQTYHPLSHLAAHSPGYWKGSALEWNTFWRLISLGLTQLVLFNLLRKLDLRADAAFLLSFLTVYNQRMLDLFRYGASLENYTGFLLLCAAMAHFYVAPRRIAGPLSIIGAAYLVICGGHPQMAYFGGIGAALICLAIPFVVGAIKTDIAVTSRRALRFYITAGLCFGVGVLLASAYTLPFYFEFLQDAPGRAGLSYAWSLGFSDRIQGELNNFFHPLRSDVHGAFGSSPLILVAVLAPLAAIARRERSKIMIVLLLALALIVLCSAGGDSPIHYFFWKYFPLANSFRVPGRITMLLPPILMFILAWFFRTLDDDVLSRKTLIAPSHLLLLSAAIFVAGYFLLAGPGFTDHVPLKIHPRPGWVDAFVFWSGLGCLALAAIRVSRFPFRMAAGSLLILAVVFQGTVQLRYGTWIAQRKPTPTLEQMNQAKRSTLAYAAADPGLGMESKTVIEQGAQVSPWAAFYRQETNAPLASSKSDVITIPRPGEPGALPASMGYDSGQDRVASVYSAFNRTVFDVKAHRPGFLVLSVPYSAQWRTFVDSRDSAVRRTDRNEQAVWLAPGDHRVEFRFHSPSAIAGMIISCLTAILTGVYFASRCRRGWVRRIAVIAVVLIPAGAFALWRNSLYQGEDLGTKYVWVSSSQPE